MLALYRPHRELFHFGRDFDSLFNLFEGNGKGGGFQPAVDITEQEDKLIIAADMPGVEEKDIEVTVENGLLTLSGKRDDSKEEKTEHGSYRERRYGSFFRQFRLGTDVDSSAIEASYKNGELTVVLPKKEAVKPRQIPLKVEH